MKVNLLPNESLVCEWGGVTVTTSRIVIQKSSANESFDLEQFPVEDYRGLNARFRKSTGLRFVSILLLTLGILCVAGSQLVNPNSVPAPQKISEKQMTSISEYETSQKIAMLESQKEEIQQKKLIFFEATRKKAHIEDIDRKIENLRKESAQKSAQLEQENIQIREQNVRAEQLYAAQKGALQKARNYLYLGAMAALIFAALAFFSYRRSGNIQLELNLSGQKSIIIPQAGGKEELQQALNFASSVNGYLNPIVFKVQKSKVAKSAA